MFKAILAAENGLSVALFSKTCCLALVLSAVTMCCCLPIDAVWRCRQLSVHVSRTVQSPIGLCRILNGPREYWVEHLLISSSVFWKHIWPSQTPTSSPQSTRTLASSACEHSVPPPFSRLLSKVALFHLDSLMLIWPSISGLQNAAGKAHLDLSTFKVIWEPHLAKVSGYTF